MPKKIKFESFIYRFLIESREFKNNFAETDIKLFDEFIKNINFEYINKKVVVTSYKDESEIKLEIPLDEQFFYIKGDTEESQNKQKKEFPDISSDPVMDINKDYFLNLVKKIYEKYLLSNSNGNIPG
tara:strand:- start:5388 stop:5768 length:381 start_codon:yes stop_codon:yes gene_type:complete